MINYVPLVYATSLPVIILFAMGALIICYFESKKSANNSLDNFLAAKRT